MDKSFQISTRGNYGGLDLVLTAKMCNNSRDHTVLGKDFRDLGLLHIKIFLHFADLFHVIVIFDPVRLNTQTMHRRTLSPVEHTALDKTGVGGFTHFSAESVNLADKVSLSRAADRGIAGHIRDIVQRNCKHDGFRTQPRRRKSRLHTRVSRADHGNVVAVYIMTHFYPLQFCTYVQR